MEENENVEGGVSFWQVVESGALCGLCSVVLAVWCSQPNIVLADETTVDDCRFQQLPANVEDEGKERKKIKKNKQKGT